MRIISGIARGRRLKSIRGSGTRPTTDRVKEALFNILGQSVIETDVLDLFAGFGSLGLEALSRGANSAVFVEKNYRNVNVINDNIKLCGFEELADVVKKDVFTYLRETGSDFDVIFMDPPYHKKLANKAVGLIVAGRIIREQGLIVIEHHPGEEIITPEELDLITNREYGKSGITILKK
ncbi:16S rRNA (guanine(966)-N(2))-methyltransferase RsmD [Halothermothrix orenii]|uniref:Putative methyltransferase n=1 Tax=Halothermothrix orenii (strain H 168 / OCM 544 / DSM 9562) TaxID=373903 RepID=B8CWV0_HALOH|nr:16S rRNA (guanine(966)-N(2))-methyltransferase RsmD [Halothermothrix orenii]ACL69769.1 putative methyltransferase [Halothermothrix orenii H 168]